MGIVSPHPGFTTEQIRKGEIDPSVNSAEIRYGIDWWGDGPSIDSQNMYCTITNAGIQRVWQATFQNFDIGPELDHDGLWYPTAWYGLNLQGFYLYFPETNIFPPEGAPLHTYATTRDFASPIPVINTALATATNFALNSNINNKNLAVKFATNNHPSTLPAPEIPLKFFQLAARGLFGMGGLPNQTCQNDPLILDLNGDGITISSQESGTFLDMDNNGFAENIGWIDPDDGFLAIDLNNNDIVDGGNELFGDQYVLSGSGLANNGFEALADLDTNSDGKIDSLDTEFANLKVLKGDGDLYSLSELDIKSINLSYSGLSNQTDANGNIKVAQGSYIKNDDTSLEISEYSLSSNPTVTVIKDLIEISQEILELPEVISSGNVYWLRQAMARDTSGELKALVQEFVDEENPTTRDSLLDQILEKWTNNEDVNPLSRGNYDARKLGVIEAFIGQFLDGSDTSLVQQETIPLLNEKYSYIKETVYAQLMCQSHLKNLFGMSVFYDEPTQTYSINFNSAMQTILDSINTDSNAGKLLLREFTKFLKGFGLFDTTAGRDFYNTFYYRGEEYQFIMDTASNTAIYGTQDYDTLVGTDADEAIFEL
ncbi:MAG: hypothetical protein WC220_11535, partial [Pedobacter sp.]